MSDDWPGTPLTRRAALAAMAAGGGATALGALGLAHRQGWLDGGSGRLPSDPLSLVPDGSATHRATASGRWSDPATWAGGAVPPADARVRIPADVAVTVANELDPTYERIRVDGTLRVDPTADTHLRVGTLVGTAGSSLAFGTAEAPVEPTATARLTFADRGPIDEAADPARLSRGLLAMGDLSVHGAETTSWTTLAKAPQSGDRSVVLGEVPTNWRVGDEVVVPGLEPTVDHDEVREIAAVQGREVHLASALERDHVPPAADLDTYALNLSRNVVFASESTDVPRRGHVMIFSPGALVRYLEARELGRTDKTRPFTNPPGGRGEPEPAEPPNPRARYALHVHRTGPRHDTHHVEGCSIRGSPGWGIVNHESAVDVLDNVTYRVTGAGVVAEKGNEVGRVAGNFALRSAGSGELVDAREHLAHNRTGKVNPPPNNIDDFGHGGHGFWFQSPALEVVDNVAAGHRHHGFVYWLRSLVEDPSVDAAETLKSRSDGVPDFPEELLTERERRAARVEDGLAFSSDMPIRQFEGNTCFASGGGMDVSRQQFRRSHFRYEEWGALEGFTVYNVGPLIDADGERVGRTGGAKSGGNLAVDVRLAANVAVRNCRFLGSGDGTAIWRSFPYTDSILVENCDIEHWAVGFVPAQFGGNNMENLVLDSRFDNDVDVEVGDRFSGDLALEGNSFADGGTAIQLNAIANHHASPGRVATVDTGIELDGATVYHDVSRPDAVFVPDEGFASKLKNRDRWAEDRYLGESPDALVGKTTQEVFEEYGITVRGGVAPPEAEEHPLVEGGVVAPPSAEKSQPTDEVWVDGTAYDGETNGDYAVVADEGAARGRALKLTEPDRRKDAPPGRSGAIASYEIALDRAGPYHLAARLGATHHDGPINDSVWARVDDGEWTAWENLYGRYLWHRFPLTGHSSGTQQPGRTLDLDAGTHTVAFGARGVEVFLDQFVLRHATTGATAMYDGRPPTE